MTAFNKSLSGVIDAVGTVTPLRRKYLSGWINPTGTVARKKYLHASLSAAINPTGNLAVVHYHETITRSLSGFISPTGSLTAKKSTTTSGTITPVGSLQKTTIYALTGAINPAGAVIQGQVENLSAAITPVGSVSILWLKSLGGRLDPLGDLIGNFNGGAATRSGVIVPYGTVSFKKLLALTGSINPAGTVAPAIRVADVALGGTVNMVSVLTAVPLYTDVDVSLMNTAVQYDLLIEQGAAFYRKFRWVKKDGVPFDLTKFALRMTIRPTKGDATLYASSDTGGVITIGSAANGVFTVTILSAYTAAFDFTRAVYEITASWSSAGNTVRTRLLEGNVTLSRAVTPTTRYTSTGAGYIQPVGSIVTLRGHSTAGLVDPWGALSYVSSFKKSLSGTITPAASLKRDIDANLSGTITPAGAETGSKLNDTEGAINPAGAVVWVVAYTKALSGTITPTGGS